MPVIHPDIESAYEVLEGKELSRELAQRLAALEGPDVVDLASLANKVRARFAPEDHVCTILNAKSGDCSQDCRYCAQSAYYRAQSPVYSLLRKEEIVAEAAKAYGNGVRHFGIVTSGYGYLTEDDEFGEILEAMELIREWMPDLGLCASLGVLSEGTAARLAENGLAHYNHNLQVSSGLYWNLVSTTHSVEDRIATIRRVKEAGIKVCAGAILGLGETMEDRVDLAYELKELGADVIPLNVLIPISGTPLEDAPLVTPSETSKTFAIFRLVHPEKTIKFAAGRETVMRDWQGLLMLSGANGLLTGGYLTTRGRLIEEDRQLLKDTKCFRETGSVREAG